MDEAGSLRRRATSLALDDAALAIAHDGVLDGVQPSIVEATRGSARFGMPATAAVRATATAVSSRHWYDVATGRPPAPPSVATARAELAARFRVAEPDASAGASGIDGAGDDADSGAAAHASGVAVRRRGPLQIAVPAVYDAAGLSRVLALCNALSLSVAGFVDAAALTGAALRLARGAAIVIEVGLHHVGATRLDVGAGEVRRRAARVRSRGGLFALQESWLHLIGEAAVLRTRFDPLHDPTTEQRLYAQLPGLVAAAATDGSARVEFEANGEIQSLVLSRDQFAARGATLYADLVAMIHELRPAGVPVSLVATQAALLLPGLREALAEFRGCELFEVPEGFAAVAASQLPVAPRIDPLDDEGATRVRLARGVAPFATVPMAAAVRASRLGDAEAAALAVPTHLLWSGRALPLRGARIEVGRDPGPDGIVLAEGMAGVSRLHCTVCDDAGMIMVVDHSRHGTWVNGERVAGRARLRSGDRLRVGDPGVELELISVG